MKVFSTNIEDEVKGNEAFRRVLYTGAHLQLVAMRLEPGEQIGSEVHEDRDQFFLIEEGCAEVQTDFGVQRIEEDSVVVVPAGIPHNVINPSSYKDLKLCTIYAPPEHPEGTVHRTKEEAESAKAVVV